MNLCFVSREYPPLHGGIGTYVETISRLLTEAGHTVHVLTAEADGEPPLSVQGSLYVHRIPFVKVVGGQWLLSDEALKLGLRHLFYERDMTQVFGWMAAYKLRSLVPEYAIELVEGPEYEAPLYFAQVQRLIDPTFPRAPMVVYMHSPSYMIFEHNKSDLWSRLMVHRRHYETLTLEMADAVVSPSRHLARRAERDAGLAEDAVEVIRLPVENLEHEPFLGDRLSNRVLGVGTLSYLKGTDIAFEACRRLASEQPQLRLRLIGRDFVHDGVGRTMQDQLTRRLPAKETRFAEFLPPRPRRELRQEYLSAACLISPARWENCPYVVSEAMSYGCPVIGARRTGIEEMIEDGVQGFLAEPTPESTLDALRRFFALPADARREMSAQARRRVAELFDPKRILAQRVEHYRRAIERGPVNAGVLPRDMMAVKGRATADLPAPQRVDVRQPGRVAVVIPHFNLGAFLPEALDSVRASDRPADEVLVVDDGSTEAASLDLLAGLEKQGGVRVLRQANQGLSGARNEGFRNTTADYVVFLDADDLVDPAYLGKAAAALDAYPAAGAAGSWVRHFGEVTMVWAPPLATFPFLLMENAVSTGAMVRRDALDRVGLYSTRMDFNYEDWELWVRLRASGRAILLIPEPLFHYRVRVNSLLRTLTPGMHGYLRGLMRELHPDLFDAYGADLALMVEQFYVHSRQVRSVYLSDLTWQTLHTLQACLKARNPLKAARTGLAFLKEALAGRRRLRHQLERFDPRIERL